MAQIEVYIDIMVDSLRRKKEYLSEILRLSKEQEEIAKQEKFDDDKFGEKIDEKEVFINNINEIDKGFSSVYDRVRSDILENKEAYKDSLIEMQNLIRACVDIGMEIEALEERNRALLEQVFSTQFKGIKQVKKSKAVANNYYRAMSNGNVNDSILYDRKK